MLSPVELRCLRPRRCWRHSRTLVSDRRQTTDSLASTRATLPNASPCRPRDKLCLAASLVRAKSECASGCRIMNAKGLRLFTPAAAIRATSRLLAARRSRNVPANPSQRLTLRSDWSSSGAHRNAAGIQSDRISRSRWSVTRLALRREPSTQSNRSRAVCTILALGGAIREWLREEFGKLGARVNENKNRDLDWTIGRRSSENLA
jgi:hypothetical protein